MARSWQDLGKASTELAMDLGKGTMASNTGKRDPNREMEKKRKKEWKLHMESLLHKKLFKI